MTPKRRPHQGNVRRDIKIFILFDSGQFSQKQIASLVATEGFHCTKHTVYDALKRRERYALFYEQQISDFLRFSRIESDRSTA